MIVDMRECSRGLETTDYTRLVDLGAQGPVSVAPALEFQAVVAAVAAMGGIQGLLFIQQVSSKLYGLNCPPTPS